MAPLCYRPRFPPEIIQHAMWLYLRFTLSYRDVEELLAERGLDISYETVRRIAGERMYLWRAVDHGARFSTCWFSVDGTPGRRCG
jgi:transposase-like protein